MGVLFTHRFLYAKSCLWQAFSRPCLAITPLSLSQQGPRWEMMEQGALPFSRLTPHNHTHLQRSSAATCQTADTHGLLWIHPKMGSTLESRGWVRVAGKPSDEPLHKGETQSPEVNAHWLTLGLTLVHTTIQHYNPNLFSSIDESVVDSIR